VPQGRGDKNKDVLLFSNEEKEYFTKLVKSLKSRIDGVSVRTGSPFNCLFDNKSITCNAGFNRVLINPEGNVFPCEAFKQNNAHEIKNIKKSHLQSIFNSTDLFNLLRERRVSGCSSKSCPAQSYIYTDGASFDDDPFYLHVSYACNK